jgi:hypothetical protein
LPPLGETKAFFVNTLGNEPGALKDVESMEDACQARRFDFECLATQSNDDLKNLSQRLADEKFTKFSKVVVMMLGHGNWKDQIISHNGNCYIF